MKISIVLIAFAFSSLNLFAQDNEKSNWVSGGQSSLLFNQVSFVNWAKGGENSISGIAKFAASAKYLSTDSVVSWDNTLDLAYGLMNSEQFNLRKTEDKIDFATKFGHRAFQSFYYSALVNFKSQFAAGYNYPNDSLVVSDLLAPAYVIASLGMDHKPIEELSIYLSPATGRMIIVNNTTLADSGAYGVKKGYFNQDGTFIHGEKTLFSFGAYLKAHYKSEIMKNVVLSSKLELFNNYTDVNEGNRANIDVSSETTLNLKVNDYISATIFLNLLYDHDILVPIYETIDGVKTKVREGRRLQINQAIGVGFSYKFDI